jgi:hypothetical protein
MRVAALLLLGVPLLLAAAPAYQRWGEVDFGGRRAVYFEEDSGQPGLVAMALCTTSSSVVEWRQYRAQATPALDRAGPARAISDCDRACQLATQAIARRNALPEADLQPRSGTSWSLTKAAAVAQLRAQLAQLSRPRAIDDGTARREEARARDIVTRFERQCGGQIQPLGEERHAPDSIDHHG